MTEKEFNEIIEELRSLCFETEADMYYCDKCLEFDDVFEVLSKRIKRQQKQNSMEDKYGYRKNDQRIKKIGR